LNKDSTGRQGYHARHICVQSCFQISRGDVPIGDEEMVNHGPCGYVGKTNHVIIQNRQVPWFKNSDDPFLSACCMEV
jgi:hypothetical protein